MLSLELVGTIQTVVALMLAYLMVASIAGAFQAWVAYRAGDDMARQLGFTTLNPFFHVDPVSLIIMPIGYLIFGVVIGLGKPVPVMWNYFSAPYRWLKMTLVALAQPLAIMIMLYMLMILRLAGIAGVLALGHVDWLPTMLKVSQYIMSAVGGFAVWFLPYTLLLSVAQIYVFEQEKRGVSTNHTLIVLIVPLFGALLLQSVSQIVIFGMVAGFESVLIRLLGVG